MIFEAGENMFLNAFAYASVRITYIRGESVLATDIPAKLGKTVFRTDNYGISVRSETRDFIVLNVDLPSEPEIGDLVVYDGKKYFVSQPDGEPCYKWHTRLTHQEKRIHTKFSGDAD